MKYEIFEDNMAKVAKKLNTIKNKCVKMGVDFSFKEVGEVYRKGTDGKSLRYILVEASGTAKLNGWEFVATIQHATPVNVIRAFNTELTIPARYASVKPVCEHCNSLRSRKDTYLVYNAESGEFKQVGRSCLKEFTSGLSAEAVVAYTSLFDELAKGFDIHSTPTRLFHSTLEVLTYAVEAIHLYGFVKSYFDDGMLNPESTRNVVTEMLLQVMPGCLNRAEKDGFNANRPGNKEKAQVVFDWVQSLNPEFGTYLSNLKASCSEYCESRSFGLVVSAVATYNREQEKQAAKEKEAQAGTRSTWQGEIGQRITLSDVECKLITSWDGMFGYTYVYKLTDQQGNIYTWKTGSWLEEGFVSLVGTIKDHTEYKGVKQTELTRCRVKSV